MEAIPQAQCRRCKVDKDRIRHERPNQPAIFADRHGKRWNGRVCYECTAALNEAYRRSKGIGTADSITYPRKMKGRQAEHVVRKLLEEIGEEEGFSVSINNGVGPDLVLRKGEEEQTIEVKSICRKGNHFFACEITPNRQNDSAVALVFPDETVIFIPMGGYKKLLAEVGTPRGRLTVSGLIKEMPGLHAMMRPY